MAKKKNGFKPPTNRKHPDIITFRLNDTYLSKLAEFAKRRKKSYTITAKEILCSFLDSIDGDKNKSDKKNTQMKLTKNIMTLLNHFMSKYGLDDYNLAFNYLLMRALLLELKADKYDDVNVIDVWEEQINLKKLIKQSYIKKLARRNMQRLQEKNNAEMEMLSQYVG